MSEDNRCDSGRRLPSLHTAAYEQATGADEPVSRQRSTRGAVQLLQAHSKCGRTGRRWRSGVWCVVVEPLGRSCFWSVPGKLDRSMSRPLRAVRDIGDSITMATQQMPVWCCTAYQQ